MFECYNTNMPVADFKIQRPTMRWLKPRKHHKTWTSIRVRVQGSMLRTPLTNVVFPGVFRYVGDLAVLVTRKRNLLCWNQQVDYSRLIDRNEE
jgi:hypothetical protein